MTGHKSLPVLAWSGLVVSTLAFAWLFQAVAIAATDDTVHTEPIQLHISPASTGLANGDGDDADRRGRRTLAGQSTTCFCGPRFLASQTGAAIENCETYDSHLLYVGSNAWIGDPNQTACPDGGASADMNELPKFVE